MAKPPPSFLPQNIFLTGANGRLASCVRPHLHQAGRTITGFSRKKTNEHLNLESLFQPGTLERADTLLHLAWSTLPATSERDIGSEWESDLPFLIKLLRYIVESPQLARLHFIFFSSGGAVYGSGSGRPSLETDACRPFGWYAQAKVAAEEIIRIFGERHGLNYTILRVSNPYGFPVPPERAQGIIPHAFDSAWTGKPLNLWGDGSARKDFLHYSDFNRGLQAIIDRRLTGTYNLASGSSASVVEVIRQIETITQRSIRVEPGPARPWDVQTSFLDNGKLREATGWAPQLSLEEGLKRTAQELSR
jgi:UDP-glucose 4-epimerase